MNVHQSKGLQFDIVVLPELDAKLRGQPPQFVVGRGKPTEPISQVCRYVSQKTREQQSPTCAAHLRRRRLLAQTSLESPMVSVAGSVLVHVPVAKAHGRWVNAGVLERLQQASVRPGVHRQNRWCCQVVVGWAGRSRHPANKRSSELSPADQRVIFVHTGSMYRVVRRSGICQRKPVVLSLS